MCGIAGCIMIHGEPGRAALEQVGRRLHHHLYGRRRGFHVLIGEWLQGAFLDGLRSRLPANPAVRELWCLLQFAIWHRLFVDEPGRTPAPHENPLGRI